VKGKEKNFQESRSLQMKELRKRIFIIASCVIVAIILMMSRQRKEERNMWQG